MFKLLNKIINKIRSASENQQSSIPTIRNPSGQSKSGVRKQQLVIGLDFGTAFTKVVVGEQRVRYAVPFQHHAENKNSYLLPSVLSLSDDEICTLGLSAAEGRVEDLKLRLIERDFSEEVKIRCATFLALVLRHVKDWLMKEHRSAYQRREIEWFINIGLPTDRWDDSELKKVYENIVQIAWRVAVMTGPISLHLVNSAASFLFSGKSADEFLPPDRVNSFPEFAVQLMGYIQSPRRQEDLHALADVGSGTFDLAIFNVFKNDAQDLFPIFAQDVKPLGSRYLVKHRLDRFNSNTDWKPSPYENVPPDSEFEHRLSLNRSKLREHDLIFQKKIADVIRGKLKYVKNYKYPSSKHWQSGVPTFLCGGGAKVGFYQVLFHNFENAPPPYKIELRTLKTPEDLHAPHIPKGTYDRLSVAYGLADDPLNIAEIIMPKDIKTITPELSKDPGDEFIGKEQT